MVALATCQLMTPAEVPLCEDGMNRSLWQVPLTETVTSYCWLLLCSFSLVVQRPWSLVSYVTEFNGKTRFSL